MYCVYGYTCNYEMYVCIYIYIYIIIMAFGTPVEPDVNIT